MRFIGGFFRVYGVIFFTLLCLMALGVAALTIFSTPVTLNLTWLPWNEDVLARWLIGCALVGLLALALFSLTRIRVPAFLWAIAVLVILVKGLFLGRHTFHGEHDAKNSFHLVLAALVATAGLWPFFGGRRR